MSDGPATRRVLVVIGSDGAGGLQRFLAGLIPALAERGVEIDLVCPIGPPASPGPLGGHPITRILPGRLPGLLGRARQVVALRRLIARGDYAAVLGFGRIPNGLVSLTQRRPGSPIVVCERDDPFVAQRRTWNRWFTWLYRRADVLVVQTEGLADDVRRRWRPSARVVVIENPVPAVVPIRPPVADRERVIAGVGRLIPRKGYADLIEAFARLGPVADGWSVLMVGEGPARAELEAQAERLGVAGRVRFVGQHPAPWELVARTSIFVHCSRHEGCPNALLEAMASGCTVVAADCRFGPSEMIEDGVSGFLYPIGDVDRLTEQLATLVRDPDLRLVFAGRSTAWAAEQTTDCAVARWLEVIDSLRA